MSIAHPTLDSILYKKNPTNDQEVRVQWMRNGETIVASDTPELAMGVLNRPSSNIQDNVEVLDLNQKRLNSKMAEVIDQVNSHSESLGFDDLSQLQQQITDNTNAIGTANGRIDGNVTRLDANDATMLTLLDPSTGRISILEADMAIEKANINTIQAWQITTDSSLNTINSNMLTLTASVGQAETNVATLSGKVDATNVRVDNVETGVSDNKDSITNLTTTTGNLQTSITTLDAHVVRIDGEITNLKTADTALGQRIDTADTSIGNLNTAMSTAQSDISTNGGKIAGHDTIFDTAYKVGENIGLIAKVDGMSSSLDSTSATAATAMNVANSNTTWRTTFEGSHTGMTLDDIVSRIEALENA